jgi:hypothetical protein
MSASPTVMVELQFASKEGAENVIATFNNQKVSITKKWLRWTRLIKSIG